MKAKVAFNDPIGPPSNINIYKQIPNADDRVITVGIVTTVPNKFRSCAVLMFQAGLSRINYPIYTTLSHLVVSACRSSRLLAVCRLIADIKWKYPNNLNS